MYESWATDLHVTMGVSFPLLKKYYIGNKQNSCSNNYSKFMHSLKKTIIINISTITQAKFLHNSDG